MLIILEQYKKAFEVDPLRLWFHVKRSTSQMVPKSKGLQVKRPPSQKGYKSKDPQSKGPQSKGLQNLTLKEIRDKSKQETNTTTVVHTPCPCGFCGI